MGDRGNSELKTYVKAIRHCSENGNRRGVEMFRFLIYDISSKEHKKVLSKLENIMGQEVISEKDKFDANICRGNIEGYKKCLESYSEESPMYLRMLSQADANSWKQCDDSNRL